MLVKTMRKTKSKAKTKKNSTTTTLLTEGGLWKKGQAVCVVAFLMVSEQERKKEREREREMWEKISSDGMDRKRVRE